MARAPEHLANAVASLSATSPAACVGVRVGDHLITINEHPLHDILDYHFYAAEEELLLTLERGKDRLSIALRKPAAEGLGLHFAEPLFDGVRRCRNDCFFCFLKGLPKGLRSSLYIKDDDYRLSFLYGNFITLSNWSEEDWERLAQQRLSPLYVSVHATDPELRRRMLGNPRAPDILTQVRRLSELRIQIHAQVVLCPGINDGLNLERTIMDLSALHPTVRSIAIVPVGLTRLNSFSTPGLRPFTSKEVRALIAQVGPWQQRFRSRLGLGLVYLADEIYLRAGEPLPNWGSYDGFPQYQNGIGMTRAFLREWARERGRLRRGRLRSRPLSLACGTLIVPVLTQMAGEVESLGGPPLQVIPLENHFFGPTITVSGLLTGQDIIRGVQGRQLGEPLLLPRSALDADGRLFLDGVKPGELEEELGVRVLFIGSARELVRALYPGSLTEQDTGPSQRAACVA